MYVMDCIVSYDDDNNYNVTHVNLCFQNRNGTDIIIADVGLEKYTLSIEEICVQSNCS